MNDKYVDDRGVGRPLGKLVRTNASGNETELGDVLSMSYKPAPAGRLMSTKYVLSFDIAEPDAPKCRDHSNASWFRMDLGRPLCVASVTTDEHELVAEIAKKWDCHEELVSNLKEALDSLEYVRLALPLAVGYGVRTQRITRIRALLEKVEAS